MVMAGQQPETKQARATRNKAVSSKLKVFQASLGFYDTVVAVPSQAAALRAWGTHQNLFEDGVARTAEDREAVEAALAQPGVVLRRALGTNDPFGLDPGTPKIPDLPRGRKRTPRTETKGPAPETVDRMPLDRAEAELARLEEKRRAEQDVFEARRRELEAEEASASARFEEANGRARARVERERKAYVEAGGRLDP
jgi:hypothetical protein